jgi:sortase (surface protein transpeptidase)
VGDEVVVQQGDLSWVYALTTAPHRVPVTATWVLRQGSRRELTLTTCWPVWGSSERLFVRAELVDVTRGS